MNLPTCFHRWFGFFRKGSDPDWLAPARKISPRLFEWKWEDVGTDVPGAMRVALGVWRDSRWLQLRFPRAFTAPDGGGFYQWMHKEAARRLRHADRAADHLKAAFQRSAPELIADHYLHDYRLRLKHPLALVAEGRAEFAKWLLKQGVPRQGWFPEDVLWFLQAAESNEEPFVKLARAITPAWQADAATAPARLETTVARCNHAIPTSAGVTVLGHFTFLSGLQRSAMLTVGALQRSGESVSLRNIPILEGREASLRGADFLGEETHDLTILHVTPDPFYLMAYERAGLHPRDRIARIAHYAWELPAPPPGVEPLPDLREIWVYSQFVADSLRGWGLPARVIFPPMHCPGSPIAAGGESMKKRLGLDHDTFVFLYVFDVSSTLERKNPLAVIEAFRRAVRPDDNARLVLKAARIAQHAERFRPVGRAAVEAGALLLDEMLSDSDTLALISACDCYVSLHRAEGFGFTMAEAMLSGKPVIATGYSGNLDYMNGENSYPVNWTSGEVPPETLTYPAGFAWAEPDVAHAADCMRRVLDRRDEAGEKGLRARMDAARLFDRDEIAGQISDRLKAVRALPE